MLKVKEAELTCLKLKEKGKVMVVKEVCKELRREELERLLAKKAAIQEMIDNLQKYVFVDFSFCILSYLCTCLYHVCFCEYTELSSTFLILIHER
jgi:hypothetical protein